MTSRWIETWSLFLSADGSVVSLFPKCLGTWMIFHYISFEYKCWKKNNSKMSGVNVNKIKYHVNIENKRMYWEILMLIFEPWAIFSPRCCVVYFFAFPYGACLMCTRGMLISASLSRFLQVLMDWLGVNSSVLWFFPRISHVNFKDRAEDPFRIITACSKKKFSEGWFDLRCICGFPKNKHKARVTHLITLVPLIFPFRSRLDSLGMSWPYQTASAVDPTETNESQLLLPGSFSQE